MYFTVLLLLEGSEVEGPLASSLGIPPPPLKTACGVHAGSSDTAPLPRPAPLRDALVTAAQKLGTRKKTLRLKVQCPIFALIYDFCVGKTYYIAHKIH